MTHTDTSEMIQDAKQSFREALGAWAADKNPGTTVALHDARINLKSVMSYGLTINDARTAWTNFLRAEPMPSAVSLDAHGLEDLVQNIEKEPVTDRITEDFKALHLIAQELTQALKDRHPGLIPIVTLELCGYSREEMTRSGKVKRKRILEKVLGTPPFAFVLLSGRHVKSWISPDSRLTLRLSSQER